ncbi:MAG: hypothetical protein DWI58_03955 [Chloroflexi bacterium]|nr:MAG: hypothetical protein DWI58_03955 [Chloroflexota bacterium]
MSDASVLRAATPRPELIRTLAATPELVEAMLLSASETSLDTAVPGEWSARVVTAHLRDDEFMVMRLRLERMLVEDAPALVPFDESAWAASRWTGRDTIDDLVADLRMQRAASLHILTRLSDADWVRLGTQPEIGTFDIHWWVEHWVRHDVNHLDQVATSLGLTR